MKSVRNSVPASAGALFCPLPGGAGPVFSQFFAGMSRGRAVGAGRMGPRCGAFERSNGRGAGLFPRSATVEGAGGWYAAGPAG